MRAHRLRAAAVGVLVVSTSASAAAQSEKITLNVVPPLHGSTVRYDMRHELTLQATPEGDNNPVPLTNIVYKLSMRMTQQASEPDDEGRIEVKMTYDDAKIEISVNGKPIPKTETLAGRAVVTRYSADGQLIDIAGPGQTDALAKSVRDMVNQLLGQVSGRQLAVGETEVRPIAFQIPMPGGTDRSLAITGDVATKLLSVDTEESSRVASSESVLHLGLSHEFDMPAGGSFSMDVKMSGSTATRVDLDRRTIRRSDGTIAIDGAFVIHLQGDDVPARVNVHGSMKMISTEVR